MPNWVDNDLEITGPEAELERFMAECFTMEAGVPRFDFDKLIPMPATLKEGRGQDGSKGDLCGLGSRDSFFPDWYVWSVGNWGTKWNAHHTEVTPAGNDSKAIKLHFSTAWSIPWPIYEELAERFPLLTIEGEIVELMMEFGGHICCHGGKVDYEDKSEQIKAEMAEFYAKLEHEPATSKSNLSAGDDDVPF